MKMRFDEVDRFEAQWDARARLSQGAAAHAYARLLNLAETCASGQIETVARFLASVCPRRAGAFSMFDLRAVDAEISDDMLTCIDAVRWGKADLWSLVPR